MVVMDAQGFLLSIQSLYLVYQPIIRDQQLYGVEVLSRVYGQELPDVLRAQEQTGIAYLLDLRVLELLIKDYEETIQRTSLKESGLTHIHYNIQPQTLTNREHVELLLETLSTSNQSLVDILEIELNERSNFYQSTVKDNIALIKQKGYRISLDDFGTYGANIVEIFNPNIDTIKFDQSLIREFYSSGQSLLPIISTVDKLGKDIVIEGVETSSHLDWLEHELSTSQQPLKKKIQYQGYVYNAPMELSKFIETYNK